MAHGLSPDNLSRHRGEGDTLAGVTRSMAWAGTRPAGSRPVGSRPTGTRPVSSRPARRS
jgi:hypothetical protein